MFHDIDPNDKGPIEWSAVAVYLARWLIVIGVVVLIGYALGVDWTKAVKF